MIPLLVAVTALLGPPAAAAADPAPDPPASHAPTPDPAPAARQRAVHPAIVVTPVRRAAVAATAATEPPPSSRPAAAVADATVSRQRATTAPVRKQAPHRKQVRPARAHVLDVPPLTVDIHRGLGAVTHTLHDDSLLLLAGVALLVATFTAASGAAVALVAARANRSHA